MHKLVALLVLIGLISFVTITFAKSENSGQGSNQEAKKGITLSNDNIQDQVIEDKRKAPAETKLKAAISEKDRSASPAASCDPNADWKNHGQYVSCIAKLKQGGQAVSEAARSDIGKKLATHSGSLNPSPTATSSAEPSPEGTGSASPSPDVNTPSLEIQTIIETVQTLFKRLQDLLSF